jgi:hypothetical protein
MKSIASYHPTADEPFTKFVDVNVFDTAAANARRHYDFGKSAKEKVNRFAT